MFNKPTRMLSAVRTRFMPFAFAALFFATGVAAEPVFPGNGYAAYLGAQNLVCLTDETEALTKDAAVSIVYATPNVLLYETASASGRLALNRLDLEGIGTAQVVAGLSTHAVYSAKDGQVYFVDAADDAALCVYDPISGTVGEACVADSPIVRLRVGLDGLLADTADQELLYVPAIRALVAPVVDLRNAQLFVMAHRQAMLDDAGVLSRCATGAQPSVVIDSSVTAACTQSDSLYYAVSSSTDSRILSYDLRDQSTWLTTLQGSSVAALCADDTAVYALCDSGKFYRIPLDGGTRQSLVLPKSVQKPRIERAEGLVLVYETVGGEPVYVCEVAATPTVSPTPTPVPTPIPTTRPERESDFSTLRTGSRGDAVRRLQESLSDLGYLEGSVDGVYGDSTRRAITFLQGDLGETETGEASPHLQYTLFHGDVPDFDPYRPLQAGDSGIRVEEMQQRLRALYYTKAPAGGHYQTQTTLAVKRFQAELGHRALSRITAAELRRLYADSAPAYSGYLDLEKGDNAPAVRRLNRRLRSLNYLNASLSANYNTATRDAVTLFQSYNGLFADGIATAELQENMIFSPDAKKYEPEPTPIPTPTPVQVVTNKQVKTMRIWMDNNLGSSFDKEGAVTFLQQRLLMLGYFPDGALQTGVYDQVTFDGVLDFQTNEGLEPNGIADADTLQALFFRNN